MRLPEWDEPRVIGCAENLPQHIALPRGCLEAALTLLRENGIRPDLHDERSSVTALQVRFRGALRPDQQQAVDAMLAQDTGGLCAPAVFGKTVTAAALIAARGVDTVILVHRAELLRQWRERLQTFLAEAHDEGQDRPSIGAIGGGKSKPTGQIDIALMQSLYRQGEANALVEDYGHIVVDECHHLSAFSFEAILKRAKAKQVLGLTATPIRRDGRQPIIFMQCGPTRHTAEKPSGAPQTLEIVPRYLIPRVGAADDAPIQQVFQVIASDAARTAQVADEVTAAFVAGAKVLVLTERTEHLDALRQALGARVSPLHVPGHGVTLTPFYDLMCTRLYPGLSPEFAFAIGGEVRPGAMSAENLAHMARQLGMQPRFLAQQAADMAAQLPRAVALAEQELVPAMSPPARTLAERLQRFVSTSTRTLAEHIAA